MSGFFKCLILILIVLIASCSVSQQTIEKNIIGTWACIDADITKGGITFFPNGQVRIFHKTDITSSVKIQRVSHFAKGRYKIHNDFLISIVSYEVPVIKGKESLYKDINAPKGEITLRRQVKKIDRKNLVMVQSNRFDEKQTIRCEKAIETRLGAYFNDFLNGLGLKGDIADINPAKLDKFKNIQLEIKKYQDGINIIKDSSHHRKSLSKLLDITKQATPSSIRIMSIVGQDLNYQISGMADSEETVKSYVQNLQNADTLESVAIAEGHTFNVVSTSKGHKGTQKLYEFRVSLQFRSIRSLDEGNNEILSRPKMIEDLEKKLANTRNLFNQESKALVRPQQLDAILINLTTMAKESSTNYSEFKPHEQSGDGPVIELPISIKIKGTYPQLSQFLKNLAKDKHTIGLTGIQIEPDFNNIKSTDLTLSGYLNIFALNSENNQPLSYDITSLEPSYPRLSKRTSKSIQLGSKNTDPFHSFTINSPKSLYSGTQASIACQSNRNIRANIAEIKFLGLLKQHDGNAALLKIRNSKTIRMKVGQCINKQISIQKITRTKIILKQSVANADGSKRSRTVSLNVNR